MMRGEEELRDLLTEYVLGTLDAASVEDVRDALARSPQLRAFERTLTRALYALPEDLDAEPVPVAVWERIRSGARAISASDRPAGMPRSALPAWGGETGADRPGEAGWRRAHDDDVSQTGGSASDRSRREPHPPDAHPGHGAGRISPRRALVLGTALAVALLAATSWWAVHATGQSRRLADEQHIVAYWMRRPDLQILPLEAVAGGEVPNWTGTTEVAPGVVCLLPDGRAMLLQPSPPPSGTRYVLYGEASNGRVELGESHGRFLLFDHHGLSGVTLTVEGRRNGTVAQVRF